jgi:stage III sporulation protein AE
MKKAIMIICVIFLLCGCAEGAEDPLSKVAGAVPDSARELIEGVGESGAGGFQDGLISLARSGAGELSSALRGSVKSMAAMIMTVMLCNITDGLCENGKDSKLPRFSRMAGALAVVMLSAGSLTELIGLGGETIEDMDQFSKVLLPTLAAATAAAGSAAASAVREVATSFFADLLISCINGLLVPLLYIYLGAVTADAVLDNKSLGRLADVIKKFIMWSLTALVSAFTAYLTISGALASSADNLSVRAARFALSGAVPVVGSILSDAAGSLLAGAAVLKNSVGALGTLAVFAMCVAPFIRLGAQYILFKLASFLASTVDATPLASLIDKLGGAFGLVLGMTGATAFLLMISIISSVSAVTYG